MNPVAIVGAGPLGATLALLLARDAVPILLLDAKPAWEREGSNAMVVAGHTFEAFARLGLPGARKARGRARGGAHLLPGHRALLPRAPAATRRRDAFDGEPAAEPRRALAEVDGATLLVRPDGYFAAETSDAERWLGENLAAM